MQDRHVGHIKDQQDIIDEEAARWIVLLEEEPMRDDTRRSLQDWLSADPRHREAFAEAEATWNEIGALRQPDTGQERAKTRISAIAPGLQGEDASCRKARRWRSALALAACLVLAVSATLFWYGDPAIMLRANYQTAPGEQRTIRLSDGSVVDLGSGSAMALQFSNSERRIELLSGRAYFTAAPKAGAEARPFVVASSGGTATALGTQFSVDRIDDAVEVTVAEHSVAVDLDGGMAGAGVVLHEGQSVRFGASGGMGKVGTTDIGRSTAWRRGKIIFSDIPLSQVIAELNRYRRGRIVIASDRLAELKVSGVFDTNDLSRALDRIVGELNLRMSSLPPLITVIY